MYFIHLISTPEIIRRGPSPVSYASPCSRIMLTMPLRLALRGRRNIFYFSFYCFISFSRSKVSLGWEKLALFLSLSLVEKIKGGWNIRKLRSQLFARQILLPFCLAKMFPYRCVRPPSITQNAFKLNETGSRWSCVHLHCLALPPPPPRGW